MAGRDKTEYDWLEDPFDDKKNEEDFKRARRRSNIGCLVAVVAVLLIGFVAMLMSCSAAVSMGGF